MWMCSIRITPLYAYAHIRIMKCIKKMKRIQQYLQDSFGEDGACVTL